MALNQTNNLFWLIGVISRAKSIPFEEINRKWMAEERLSGGKELPKRTFHKWIDSIQDCFNLLIENEGKGGYNYYISNIEELKDGSVERWMYNVYSISNTLISSQSIKGRIIIEDIPSGHEYLDPLIDAMKTNRVVHMTYHSFWRQQPREYDLMPLCVKMVQQRWYLVGRYCSTGETRVFGLDRIVDLQLTNEIFEYPKDFHAHEFFNGCIGVIAGESTKIERVRLKATLDQAKYIRSLPIIGNQREVETYEDYCIFEMDVRPTYDYIQELLRYGANVSVLEPQWLREHMIETIGKMMEQYR